MLAARFRGRKCGSKRLSSPVLEALFFYIKAVPRSDPVPSEPMTSPQKRFCDFPLVELTGTIGYYSMLAGKGQAKRPGKAGKGKQAKGPGSNFRDLSLAPLILSLII